MPATIFAINRSLNSDFGGISGSAPATYYLGLSTTALTSLDTSGSVATEPSASYGYERYPLPNDKSTWTTATAGSLVNAISGSFASTSTAWGTIRSAFLADDSAIGSGTIWYYYTLSPVLIVQENTTVVFEENSIIASRV